MFRTFAVATSIVIFSSAASAQTVDAAHFVDAVSAHSARLSPDGNYVAYVRHKEGDHPGDQVVVVNLATHAAQAIQFVDDARGSFNWVTWKTNDRLIADAHLVQSVQGEASTGSHIRGSNWQYSMDRVFAINRDGSNAVQMFQGQFRQLLYGFGSTALISFLPNDPDHVLLDASDNQGVGVWQADVGTGHAQRVATGSEFTEGYVTDGAGYAVIRMDAIPDHSGYRVYRRANGASDWTFVLEARRAEAYSSSPEFEIVGPGPQASKVYVLARPNGRDLAALYLYDTSSGEYGAPLQEPTGAADLAMPWINEATNALIATCEDVQRLVCRTADANMQRHLNAVDVFFEHQAEVQLVNTSANGAKWLLYVEGPLDAGGYYVYDTTTAHIELIAQRYPSIDRSTLSPTQVVSYRAHDGTQLWAYVTARAGQTGPRAMVVMPHGGPEVRDTYGFDGFTQFLASRGYVVLQPNFRGGGGFGRAFSEAGHRQWGRLMQDDISDAVRHMVDAGVADPHRICIVGASYGGYAALAGATLTPDLYRCAVSISGVSDLDEMVRHESAGVGRGSARFTYWAELIGDPARDHDAIVAASPSAQAAHATAPILLIHGDADGTVPIHQSELMDQALRSAGHPAQFIRLHDEGHIWDNWKHDDRLMVFQTVDAFLAQNLGPAR